MVFPRSPLKESHILTRNTSCQEQYFSESRKSPFGFYIFQCNIDWSGLTCAQPYHIFGWGKSMAPPSSLLKHFSEHFHLRSRLIMFWKREFWTYLSSSNFRSKLSLKAGWRFRLKRFDMSNNPIRVFSPVYLTKPVLFVLTTFIFCDTVT